MVIKASKTVYILIGIAKKFQTVAPRQLCLCRYILRRVGTSKYLGVLVYTHLSWILHVDKLYSKLLSRTGVMKRIRNFLDFSTSQLIYNAIVSPLLDNSDVVWDSCNVQLVDYMVI